MNELVSVVVPIFNVENYLKKCLDSILKQSYRNIEIILIDDGSTDDSLTICLDYKSKNNNIMVIHQDNAGLSAARNVGIKNSHGVYICFVDPDDYLSSDYIERLYNQCINNNSDIACCSKAIVWPDRTIVINQGKSFTTDNLDALGKMFTYNCIDNSACDKLFKKGLFKNISFPEGFIYEDIGTIYKVFLRAKRVSYVNFVGYYYIMRKNSISNMSFSDRQMDALRFAEEARMSCGINKDLYEKASSFYYMILLNTILKIRQSGNYLKYRKKFLELRKEYRRDFHFIISNRYLPLKKKVMSIFVFFGFYKLVYYLKYKNGRI